MLAQSPRTTDPVGLWRTLRLAFALLLALTATTEVAALLVLDLHLTALPAWQQIAVHTGFLTLAVGVAGRLIIAAPLLRRFSAQHAQLAARTAELEHRSSQQETEAQLRRALEMADDEARVLRNVSRALDAVALEGGAELLLADSSQAHLRRAVATREADAACARCGVGSPRHCTATRHGSMQVFPSSVALDACPFLGDRENPPCSAACIPVSIAGRTVGVLHAVGADKRLPSQAALNDLAMIASHTGARLGVLRAMEASERAATTDPLTGLYNRRSLEARIDTLLRANERFALAIADIDHFKKLNDTHGHSMGDRTLQTFARSLRASMRPDDVVARYGGEEFVIVIVGVNADEAEAALERIRAELPTATARAGVPTVTASYGLTDSTQAGSLDALIRIADDALYTAKREGRDRIVRAPEPSRRPAELPVALARSRA